MNQTEIKEAIAEQEEYLKRRRSCMDVLGRAHRFEAHGTPGPDGTIRANAMVSRCITCGVTETAEGYRASLEGAERPSTR